ncbi:MAG TPA: hypothetical protein PLM63_03965 [bacterium]|nr:hypothetical protein [bacterium]
MIESKKLALLKRIINDAEETLQKKVKGISIYADNLNKNIIRVITLCPVPVKMEDIKLINMVLSQYFRSCGNLEEGYIDYYDKVVENDEEVTLLQIVNFIVDMEE